MKAPCNREFDFALIIDGVAELTPAVTDALFNAGCDDATFSIQYGRLYAEFSREEKTFEEAIVSAILDIFKAKIGAVILRVDGCELVTPAEIARRVGRSRQLVHQWITSARGPGNFPPPDCHLTEEHPLWAWCAVSWWLAENSIIRREAAWDAEVVAVINNMLESLRHKKRSSKIVEAFAEAIEALEKNPF